jgi:cytochrome c5
MKARNLFLVLSVSVLVALITGCIVKKHVDEKVVDLINPVRPECGHGAGDVKDEASCVGRTVDSFPAADEDYFLDMDYGVTKDPKAVAAALSPYVPGITPEQAVKAAAIGRNNWIVWTGGNDRFWDQLSRDSVGNLDFLKTLSSHPGQKRFSRDNRWEYLGLVNEPCFEKATAPRADRFGLWLDVRNAACTPDPFENEAKYPGVKIGSRGTTVPVGSFYGYATGVVGLRLFPNPDFDEAAAKRWNPERYYNDPSYYNDKKLVKPYRVGMSCGFCHVGPNPTNPPKDPEHPEWANLNSNPGAQYFWVDRIFTVDADPTSFAYQLFHTSHPGALDTSFVSTDYINNPRTMNAVYNLGPRMAMALKLGKEKLAGGELDNSQLNSYLPANSPLNAFFKAPDTTWTPRVLKDGSDSVGALGALNRVYVNIGLFSEEWLQHFIPLVGGKVITPFPIAHADKNSAYWNATKAQTPDLALFFLATGKPDYLKSAPGGDQYLTKDRKKLTRGKAVFAENCARCHSSKIPEKAFSFFPDGGCVGPNYLTCWNRYWDWTKTREFKRAATKIVLAKDFLEDNYLSTELRVPSTLMETNACSPLATNALRGNIWDNFSSQSYKDLPSVGKVTVHHPLTGEPRDYEMPAGGRGYTRPASLVSLWSTAPFLQNNRLGPFYWSGSVPDRMKSFDASIQQLLWPEKREGDRKFSTRSGKLVPGHIDLTTATSYLKVPKGFLPDFLQKEPLYGLVEHAAPWAIGESGVEIGPIPKGTPVNLVSNVDLEQRAKVFHVLLKAKRDFKSLPPNASDEQARAVLSDLVEPLISVSKCPDFIVNRGHYFGTAYAEGEKGLSDADKWALIEFLKTM